MLPPCHSDRAGVAAPPCHSDRTSGASEWRNLWDRCWKTVAFSLFTDFSTRPSASLEMTASERHRNVGPEAAKRRHFHSLGREPQGSCFDDDRFLGLTPQAI